MNFYHRTSLALFELYVCRRTHFFVGGNACTISQMGIEKYGKEVGGARYAEND